MLAIIRRKSFEVRVRERESILEGLRGRVLAEKRQT